MADPSDSSQRTGLEIWYLSYDIPISNAEYGSDSTRVELPIYVEPGANNFHLATRSRSQLQALMPRDPGVEELVNLQLQNVLTRMADQVTELQPPGATSGIDRLASSSTENNPVLDTLDPTFTTDDLETQSDPGGMSQDLFRHFYLNRQDYVSPWSRSGRAGGPVLWEPASIETTAQAAQAEESLGDQPRAFLEHVTERARDETPDGVLVVVGHENVLDENGVQTPLRIPRTRQINLRGPNIHHQEPSILNIINERSGFGFNDAGITGALLVAQRGDASAPAAFAHQASAEEGQDESFSVRIHVYEDGTYALDLGILTRDQLAVIAADHHLETRSVAADLAHIWTEANLPDINEYRYRFLQDGFVGIYHRDTLFARLVENENAASGQEFVERANPAVMSEFQQRTIDTLTRVAIQAGISVVDSPTLRNRSSSLITPRQQAETVSGNDLMGDNDYPAALRFSPRGGFGCSCPACNGRTTFR